MNLKTITQDDADSLIEEFNLLDAVYLNKTQEKNLRKRLNDMSSNLKRGHNLPDINLEILEVLITECKNKFDTTKKI